ncbi:MAG: hypothetical protein KDA25_03025 [Phycisphaerales bacterium]|nr:hypothetical protein [Phycisphaerales bacterium]
MVVSLRAILFVAGVLALGVGIGVAFASTTIGIAVMIGAVALLVVAWQAAPTSRRTVEPESILELGEPQRVALLRGTSMSLTSMRYRYSIRADRSGHREPFDAVVNDIQLGFVPVVILENSSGRQGYGYVAFVYDGHRWRGPGLPCGGDRETALAHAARCVSPIESRDA